MDIVAHALWAGVGAATLSRRTHISPRSFAGIVMMAVLPDIPHFMPLMVWVFAGDAPLSLLYETAFAHPGAEPMMPELVHLLGRHLYFIMHSAIVAMVVTILAWAVRRRFPIVLLGWWSHIVIDVFTHSREFYPVTALYPISDRAFDGVAWNMPWFILGNYLILAVAYIWLAATRKPGAPIASSGTIHP